MSPDRWRALLPLAGDLPGYLALAQGIRRMAMEGRLAAGDRLPSERTLAGRLELSRTTVTRAYGELVRSGWASARQGSGTRVRIPAEARAPSVPLVPGRRTDAIDLSAAAGLAPTGTGALIGKALEWLPASLGSAGYEPFGAPHLRARVAEAYAARGVPTDAEQIVVTPGALAALSVALHALVRPGRRVLADSPTYPGALGAIAAARARVRPVGLDGAWDLDAWTSAARRTNPAAAYLIPDFHNPTGLLMPDDQRERLARVLRSSGCVAVVDETLAELRFEGPAATPFAAIDPHAISLGSLSKTLWGGIRVGWLRCPPELLDPVRTAALQLGLGASALDQLVATSHLEDPGPITTEVVDRLRRARATWLAALADRLPDWRAAAPAGGLALWVELPAPLAPRLALTGWTHRLLLTGGPEFTPDRTLLNRLRLPLTLPPEAIPEATERLAAAWDDAVAGRHTDAGVGGFIV